MSDGLQIFDVPADAEHLDDGAPEGDATAPRPRWPGSVAGGIAILMVVTWAVALACSLAGLFELGVGLSLSAILLSVLAVAAGLVAVIGRWGRGWGIAAIAVGVLLNPIVLLYGLSWIGAL
ncbi:hypothetical protein [Protaetiibacter mangrovi]|uniref:Uncharacterized protein n=1 Tax=Protaetiibacter mangrovi TaxID=2970926 RepID=A0ABT1ZG94_9MICO|nr:hypothetical protein [Protaetiibacter mangrovi]MCS0499733.1 hypothetical protein [Protaetiibacter mangrovi]TPX03015.1 hypothetical protein FJ656_19415 [Schumannella luteola]